MIDEGEVQAISGRFGQPRREQYDLPIGEQLFLTRFRRYGDRRGEVVFALERPDGRVLLHRKAHYRNGVFRLLSGGVGLQEPVLDALTREVGEETGLQVQIQSFLAVLSYRLAFEEIVVPFVSYLFHLKEVGGFPRLDQDEVEQVIAVWPQELPAVAVRLRDIPGERSYWGRWRAIAHDVVAEALG
ncbi:MAG: NUDIX hydrolase [Chloroflexota bacterium]|nr:NUDIX hydrolase [Chloroflexota bacterium]